MNARENPFSVHRVARFRYRPLGLTWEQLLAQLAALGHRAAIIGPQGSGKTTLLEDLQSRLPCPTTLVFLDNPDSPDPLALDAIPSSHILLLDGADRLSWLAWRRLRRSAARLSGLIVTSHRPGFLPTFLETVPSPEVLEQAILWLAPRLAPSLPSANDLFARHHGNLRDALRELYDLCALMPPPSAHLRPSRERHLQPDAILQRFDHRLAHLRGQ